jgi:hypothetical protein
MQLAGALFDGARIGGGLAVTIARKVYLGFGAILFMLVGLFALNIIALRREHRAKAEAGVAIDAVQAVASATR